jgi:hypothetical protein
MLAHEVLFVDIKDPFAVNIVGTLLSKLKDLSGPAHKLNLSERITVFGIDICLACIDGDRKKIFPLCNNIEFVRVFFGSNLLL